MASPVNAALCALLATAFWSLLGYALTRHLLPRALAVGAAPVVGWAAHSAATLPIFFLIGFSPLAVVAVATLCVAVSVATLKLAVESDAEATPAIPWWAFAAAAVLALVPAGVGEREIPAVRDHQPQRCPRPLESSRHECFPTQ